MKWADSVKDLENYIAYDMSESEEITHKRADLTWRASGILVKYQDAVPRVNMYPLTSYCCPLYVLQAWSFTDKIVVTITTAWNKAVRIIWNYPYDLHTILLCSLNNVQHIWNYIFKDDSDHSQIVMHYTNHCAIYNVNYYLPHPNIF